MPYFTPNNTTYTLSSPDALRQPSMLSMPIVYEPAEPQRWAYRVVTIDPREEEPLSEERLAELGNEGWLLVGIFQHPIGQHTTRVIYYFVRAA